MPGLRRHGTDYSDETFGFRPGPTRKDDMRYSDGKDVGTIRDTKWADVQIEQMNSYMKSLHDGQYTSAADTWNAFADHLQDMQRTLVHAGQALQPHWDPEISDAAQLFFTEIGATSYSLNDWVIQARGNAVTLDRMAQAIVAARREFDRVYAQYKSEMKTEYDGASQYMGKAFVYTGIPGAPVRPEDWEKPYADAQTKIRDTYTPKAQAIMEGLGSTFQQFTMGMSEGFRFQGPADAVSPAKDAAKRLQSGSGAYPGGAGGAGAAATAAQDRLAARQRAAQAKLTAAQTAAQQKLAAAQEQAQRRQQQLQAQQAAAQQAARQRIAALQAQQALAQQQQALAEQQQALAQQQQALAAQRAAAQQQVAALQQRLAAGQAVNQQQLADAQARLATLEQQRATQLAAAQNELTARQAMLNSAVPQGFTPGQFPTPSGTPSMPSMPGLSGMPGGGTNQFTSGSRWATNSATAASAAGLKGRLGAGGEPEVRPGSQSQGRTLSGRRGPDGEKESDEATPSSRAYRPPSESYLAGDLATGTGAPLTAGERPAAAAAHQLSPGLAGRTGSSGTGSGSAQNSGSRTARNELKGRRRAQLTDDEAFLAPEAEVPADLYGRRSLPDGATAAPEVLEGAEVGALSGSRHAAPRSAPQEIERDRQVATGRGPGAGRIAAPDADDELWPTAASSDPSGTEETTAPSPHHQLDDRRQVRGHD